MLILTKNILEKEYCNNKKSVAEIAKFFNCSQHKINYWLGKYHIPKRKISEAMYIKWNPRGDPFAFNNPQTLDKAFLWGLGLGLFWGEGNKKNTDSVRLGNVDPGLIRTFLKFLDEIYTIDHARLRFGLQTFTDIGENAAVAYWCRELRANRRQFYKVTVTRSGSLGTYREKSKHGVLTIYFHNKKLRDSIVNAIGELGSGSIRKSAILAQLVERVHGRSQKISALWDRNVPSNPE
ncbi:hypothetical protein HY416_03895 [Candidatus Kaiserbacteria bacterium]|nr:hypothetical protein [Candidatus Kaiserbacteria bacterium]